MRYCIYQEVLYTIIYIDVLIFTNILINYFNLSAVRKFLNIKTKHYRLIIASFAGAVSCCIVYFEMINTLILLVIKLVVAMMMVSIGFGYKNRITYIKVIICTFVFSIIFCGIMILIYEIFRPKNMAIINDVVYFEISPVVFLATTVVIYALICIIIKITNKDTQNSIVELKMQIQDAEYRCLGKIDTGSTLIEPFSGAPVIVTEQSVLRGNKIKTTRVVPYKVLGSEGLLCAVKADKIEINKKKIEKEIYIGIFIGEIDKEIKAIINSQIVR